MRKVRRAFTLVELLVAMALTIFIMAILSQAFVTALQVFRELKAIGDMQEALRSATMVLRRDLAENHFEGKRRLSDPSFLSGPNRTFDAAGNFMISDVQEGFFHVRQGSRSGLEGGDVEESAIPLPNKMLNQYVSNNNVLLFTNRLRGNRPQDFLVAPVPAGSPVTGAGTNYYGQSPEHQYQQAGTSAVNTQCVVIGYYLVPKGTTVDPSNPSGAGTPLYALYRYQSAVLPRNDVVNGGPPNAVAGTQAANYMNVAFVPQGPMLPAQTPRPQFANDLRFSSPRDLTHPAFRPLDTGSVGAFTFPVWPGTPFSPDGTALQIPNPWNFNGVPAPLPNSSGLVLTNVVSFNVRVLSYDLRPNPDPTVWDPNAPANVAQFRMIQQPDFYDIDTYPPAWLPPGNTVYPAVWDTTRRSVTNVDKTSNPLLRITSPNHGLAANNIGQPVYMTGVGGVTMNGVSLLSPANNFVPKITAVISPDVFQIDVPGTNPAVTDHTGGGSWSLNPIYSLNALQISIRVWEAATQQTRQISIIVDM